MKRILVLTLLSIAVSRVPANGQACSFDSDFQSMFTVAGSWSDIESRTRTRLQELIVTAHRVLCLPDSGGMYIVKEKVMDSLLCFLDVLSKSKLSEGTALQVRLTKGVAEDLAYRMFVLQPLQELYSGLSEPEFPKGKEDIPAKCKCDIIVGSGKSAGVVFGEVTLGRTDLIPLVASCKPPGGTYAWEILNPTEQTTLVKNTGERTKFFSQAPGSFRIKLTYTGPDGSKCESYTQIRIR